MINKMKNRRIVENFSNWNKINESSDTFDIIDTKNMSKEEATETIRKYYHDRLTYKGVEFFDEIYMPLSDKIYNVIGIGTSSSYYEEVYDPENDEWFQEEQEEILDGQETYLGYLPDADLFVSGFDIFQSEVQNVYFVKVITSENKVTFDVLSEYDTSPLVDENNFYPSQYKQLHEKYPTLIDIRLD